MQLFLSLIDPSSLGRLDYTTMGQQALMECLVAQLDEKSLKNFRDRKKNFKDISEWHGVACNIKGDVTKIDWRDSGRRGLTGSIDFQWLPSTVECLKINIEDFRPSLHGSLDFSALPHNLRFLNIQFRKEYASSTFEISGNFSSLPEEIEDMCIVRCAFKMPLCLIGIPKKLSEINISNHEFGDINLRCDSPTLKTLNISHGAKQGTFSFFESAPSLESLNLDSNKLYGSLTFVGLPSHLTTLSLDRNYFNGILVFENLPTLLCSLNINSTKFEKIVFNTNLPDGLSFIHTSHTGTSGTIDFMHFGKATSVIKVGDNQLSGSVRIAHLVNMRCLDAPNNLLEGTLDFQTLSSELLTFNLSENKLTGPVDIRSLPPNLREIRLKNNSLTGSFVIESLPATLRMMDLSNNKFEMKALIVPFGAKKLPKIQLTGNGIEKVTNRKGRKVQAKTIQL